MMLVRYNTCLGSIALQERNWLLKGLISFNDVSRIKYMLGSVDVQERSWLFKGLFSLVDVSLMIRKEGFIEN